MKPRTGTQWFLCEMSKNCLIKFQFDASSDETMAIGCLPRIFHFSSVDVHQWQCHSTVWQNVRWRSEGVKRSIHSLLLLLLLLFCNSPFIDLWMWLNRRCSSEFLLNLQEFNFDVRRIHWPTYLENYCIGVKCYALKEELSDLSNARLAIQRLVCLSVCLLLVALRFPSLTLCVCVCWLNYQTLVQVLR